MEEDIKVLEEYLNYEVTKRKLSGCEILAIKYFEELLQEGDK